MLLKSKQVTGVGRGKHIGYPTINLIIPADISIDDGIYAAWILIGVKTYKGALHYGPVLTFNEKQKTLEVYLLDITNIDAPIIGDEDIEIDIVERLRDVQKFVTTESLVEQIAKDVEKVRRILN